MPWVAINLAGRTGPVRFQIELSGQLHQRIISLFRRALPMKQITCSRNLRLLIAVLFCMISVAAVAQSAGFGAVSGVVTDSTGAVVAGAHVTLDNPSKAIHR